MRRLRRIREQKALSLRQLEQLSGVDYSTISKLETGESRNPRLETIVRLAQALGVDLSELIDPKELLATK
uniref:XRE family transcriptional regulator n=1 Tax=uncultured prokaryote TaxID=198431 RepID=H5S967_9ZZZZ|nr:XRE family transcriptional regulator [uncultured prokaryote]